MRRVTAMILAVFLLGGCSALPGEDRAFAVALGISGSSAGWQVCARVPTYQTGGGYTTVTGKGDHLGAAMADMSASAPMELHFGQVRMVIFAKALAASGQFAELLRTLSARGEVRPQAALFVTEDPVEDVMDALEPETGSRLSKSIESTMEARRRLGVLPGTTLADVLRAGERQQPVLGGAAMEKGKLHLSGGWLMGANGQVQGRLTKEEMQLASLLQGNIRQGTLALGQGTVTLTDSQCSLQLQGSQVLCRLKIRCSASTMTEEGIVAALTYDLHGLVNKLAAANSDALGVGRQAIRQKTTMAAWHDADWAAQYAMLDWFFTVDAAGQV